MSKPQLELRRCNSGKLGVPSDCCGTECGVHSLSLGEKGNQKVTPGVRIYHTLCSQWLRPLILVSTTINYLPLRELGCVYLYSYNEDLDRDSLISSIRQSTSK